MDGWKTTLSTFAMAMLVSGKVIYPAKDLSHTLFAQHLMSGATCSQFVRGRHAESGGSLDGENGEFSLELVGSRKINGYAGIPSTWIIPL